MGYTLTLLNCCLLEFFVFIRGRVPRSHHPPNSQTCIFMPIRVHTHTNTDIHIYSHVLTINGINEQKTDWYFSKGCFFVRFQNRKITPRTKSGPLQNLKFKPLEIMTQHPKNAQVQILLLSQPVRHCETYPLCTKVYMGRPFRSGQAVLLLSVHPLLSQALPHSHDYLILLNIRLNQ